MNESLRNILYTSPLYKKYKASSRFTSILFFLIASILMVVLLVAPDSVETDNIVVVYLIGIGCFSLGLYVIKVSFSNPVYVSTGTITKRKKRKRKKSYDSSTPGGQYSSYYVYTLETPEGTIESAHGALRTHVYEVGETVIVWKNTKNGVPEVLGLKECQLR